MPKESQILCVQGQQGNGMMWVLVNEENEKEHRLFMGYPTGGRPEGKYIGTWQEADGNLIWHLFEQV